MLIIGAASRQEIEAHAERGFPREVCGFLLGRVEGTARRVDRVRPVRNAWEDSPRLRSSLFEHRQATSGDKPSRAEWEAASEERRFLIDPRDYADADREASAAGLAIIGFYHSHPNHPAIPSRFDRDMAMPEQSYVIVSVQEGHAVDFRSWQVADFDTEFAEEAIDPCP